MAKFNERLKELRNRRCISQQVLADKIKTSKSSINMYERGEREPGIETLEALADFFNVDLDYLIGKHDITTSVAAPQSKVKKIPVLGYVQAGIPIDAIEEILDYEEISEDLARNGEYVGLMIQGDSMEPKFSPGDVVIVRLQPTCESGDICVVLVNGDEATVKKVERTSAGIKLIPLNSAYDPLFFTNQEIEELPVRIFGRVVELRAKF